MKHTFLIIAVILFTSIAWLAAGQTRILIITGGHDFEQKEFYDMFRSLTGVAFDTITHPAANKMLLDSKALKRYDCLVFYDMVQEISEEQKAAWLKLLAQGKGMVFLHHSLVSYQKWPEFQKIIGGKYLLNAESNHPPSTYRHDVDFRVQVVDKSHPVCRGVSDYDIHDEVYGGYLVNNEVTPLLRTNHPESTPIVGWCHNYQKSRVVYLQGGHDHFAYLDKNFRLLVLNAINWVSDGEKPQQRSQ